MMNWRVAPILYIIVSVVVVGIMMVVALVAGHDDEKTMITTVICGFALALPVTYFVTSRLIQFTANSQQN